jgi:hypothetical protein
MTLDGKLYKCYYDNSLNEEKMRFRRFIGLAFIGISVLLALSSFTISGAVIGSSLFGNYSFVVIGFFIAGFIVLFSSATLEMVAEEGIVGPDEFVDRIQEQEGRKAFILDSSLLFSYTPRGAERLIQKLNKLGEVIVPDAVLDEIKNKRLRDYVTENSVSPTEGFEKYRDEATALLEQGYKAFYHEEVIPIILGEKKPPSSRREAEPYVEAVKKLMSALNRKGLTQTKDNLVAEAERHWKVSSADRDVLAASLAEESNFEGNVVIGEKDRDFDDAVGILRKERVSCVTPYLDVA